MKNKKIFFLKFLFFCICPIVSLSPLNHSLPNILRIDLTLIAIFLLTFEKTLLSRCFILYYGIFYDIMGSPSNFVYVFTFVSIYYLFTIEKKYIVYQSSFSAGLSVFIGSFIKLFLVKILFFILQSNITNSFSLDLIISSIGTTIIMIILFPYFEMPQDKYQVER